MFALRNRISRLETRIDAWLETFLFHHRFWGLVMIFLGVPLVTLAAVCACTAAAVLPIALLFGWI